MGAESFPDHAMVSRIRVEVRGSTMQAAEAVAGAMVMHAIQVANVEGVAAQFGSYTDHFFNYPQMTGKPTDPVDSWSELGLRYYGRIAFTFEPALVRGGHKQYGHVVLREEIAEPPEAGRGGWKPLDFGDERALAAAVVTDKVIVLDRAFPVTRDYSWEGTPAQEPEPPEAPEASGEEILDNITRLVNVSQVEVDYLPRLGDGGWWRVRAVVQVGDGTMSKGVESLKPSLREAALDAYGQCGQEVTHYETVPLDSRVVVGGKEDTLTEDVLSHEITSAALEGRKYDTLVVGSTRMELIAKRILGAASSEGHPRSPIGGLLLVKRDDTLGLDEWRLVEAGS